MKQIRQFGIILFLAVLGNVIFFQDMPVDYPHAILYLVDGIVILALIFMVLANVKSNTLFFRVLRKTMLK